MPESNWPADNVERRGVESLVPYARNARTHSDEQVQQIAASIREWGWTVPILLDEDSGIIAGHGRVLAAEQLGIEEVPCMVARGWSESQKRAYVIADNKLTELAGWDRDMLGAEMQALIEAEFDPLLTGFAQDEVDELLGLDYEQTDLPPSLGDDETPITQMTVTLHRDQLGAVQDAIELAKRMGPFVDTGNENSNGNAVARICETFLTDYGVTGDEHSE